MPGTTTTYFPGDSKTPEFFLKRILRTSEAGTVLNEAATYDLKCYLRCKIMRSISSVPSYHSPSTHIPISGPSDSALGPSAPQQPPVSNPTSSKAANPQNSGGAWEARLRPKVRQRPIDPTAISARKTKRQKLSQTDLSTSSATAPAQPAAVAINLTSLPLPSLTPSPEPDLAKAELNSSDTTTVEPSQKRHKTDSTTSEVKLTEAESYLDSFNDASGKKNSNFLPDEILIKIAAAAARPGLADDKVERACHLMDKNLYLISDETSRALLDQLNAITSGSAVLEKLKLRLLELPDKKIPEHVSLIWHGATFPQNTIDTLIGIRNTNPSFKIRVYVDNDEVMQKALTTWVSSRKGEADFLRRYRAVENLKKTLEVKKHADILNAPSIKQKYPKLIAYAQRFSEKTQAEPNYALVSDIERYALLAEGGGWYIDCDVKWKKPVLSNARAEAGIVLRPSLRKPGWEEVPPFTDNNSIIATHPNSSVISKILATIHADFDKKIDQFDGGSLFGEILRRYRKYYKEANFDARIGKVPPGEESKSEPLTMMPLSRFSYINMGSFSLVPPISRTAVTVVMTGPRMLEEVLYTHISALLPEGGSTPKYDEIIEDLKMKVNIFAADFEPSDAVGKWGQNVLGPSGTAGETSFPVLTNSEDQTFAQTFLANRLKKENAKNTETLHALDQSDVVSLSSRIASPDRFTSRDLDLMKYHLAKGTFQLDGRLGLASTNREREKPSVTWRQAIGNILTRNPQHDLGKLLLWLEELNKRKADPAYVPQLIASYRPKG